MRRLLWLLAICLGTSTAAADRPITRLDGSRITSAEIDSFVPPLMQAAHVPGLGIALLNGRRVVYLKTFGERDRESHLPLTPDSVMTGASFTKAAFAYLTLQLVDEGRLELDRPVHNGLGWGLFFARPGMAFFKEGHDDGWQHYSIVFDERRIGIVLMSNSSNAESIFPALLDRLIANTYTPIDWEGYVPFDRRPTTAN